MPINNNFIPDEITRDAELVAAIANYTHNWSAIVGNPWSPAIAYPGDPNGVLGTLRLTGNNAGWQGFQFADVGRSLLVSAITQGFYKHNGWVWRFDNGTLAAGSVPANLIAPATFDGAGGTYTFSRNTPAINNFSYAQGTLQLFTNNGSRPILGFHRGGVDAIALYYDGGQNLRVRANTGEDYRIPPETSGTWTPVFRGLYTYGSATNSNSGVNQWTRLGNTVRASFVLGNVVPTGIPTGEPIVIAGLPFFSQNVTGNYGSFNITGWTNYNLGTGYIYMSGRVPQNANYCEIIKSGNGIGLNSVLVSAVTNGSNWIEGNIVYQAA